MNFLTMSTSAIAWNVSGGTVRANISKRVLSLSAFAVEAGDTCGQRLRRNFGVGALGRTFDISLWRLNWPTLITRPGPSLPAGFDLDKAIVQSLSKWARDTRYGHSKTNDLPGECETAAVGSPLESTPTSTSHRSPPSPGLLCLSSVLGCPRASIRTCRQGDIRMSTSGLSPHPFHSFILSYWLTSKSLSEARMNSKDWLRAYVSRPQVSKMFTPRLMSLREKLY